MTSTGINDYFRSRLALTILASACMLSSGLAAAAEQPVAPEKNPPGDIPDTQVFVLYRSPAGFSLKVPEGWARTTLRDGVRYADKYNTIVLTVAPAATAPSVASVRQGEAAAMVRSGRSVKIRKVTAVKLASGSAIMIDYTANSDPNPVTNKQLRLEGHSYLYYRNGKQAVLDLNAPLGADNADQWRLMANSFRWN